MAVYERSAVVPAPLAAVWAFHARIDGLVAVTPDWLHLRVESLDRPPETADPELAAGTRVALSVRPFGAGRRIHWTSEIREARAGSDEAVLTDEMIEGPFPVWRHTHRFTAVTGGTRIRDVIEYRLPGGPFGRLLAPVLRVGLAPLFRYRHHQTQTVLRDDNW